MTYCHISNQVDHFCNSIVDTDNIEPYVDQLFTNDHLSIGDDVLNLEDITELFADDPDYAREVAFLSVNKGDVNAYVNKTLREIAGNRIQSLIDDNNQLPDAA